MRLLRICSQGTALICVGLFFSACGLHHWAEIKSSELPPPPGKKEIHTGRLIVQVMASTKNTQCLKYERYRSVCYQKIRSSLRTGLVRSLWPAFPEVLLGDMDDATPNDYVLQVDATMDALPPDSTGPGWSAGVKLRYRLLRDGTILQEETTASRSRPEFAYGAPLGGAGSEVIDATLMHVADQVSQVPELRPFPGVPLPQVASKTIEAAAALTKPEKQSARKKSRAPEASQGAKIQ